MRPDNKYDRIRRVESSRTRVHLTADLGWLSGFPVRQVPDGIVWWQCTPDQNPLGTEIRVDREKIRRAEFTLNRFEHESRKVQDGVPVSAQWAERVHLLLDRFKSAIHSGEPLPSRLSEALDTQPASVRGMHRELLRKHPALELLTDAISWRLYLEPAAFRSILVWLAENAGHVLGLLANTLLRPEEKWSWVMSLQRMAQQHGAVRMARLIRYLGEPRLSETPFVREEYNSFLQLWSRRLSHFQPNQQTDPIPERPTTTLADQVHLVAVGIAQQPGSTQSQALDLFNLLVDDALLDAWYSFTDRVEAAVSLARRMTCASTAGQFEPRAAKSHADFFNNLAKKEIPSIRFEMLPSTLEFLYKPNMRLVREELLRTLPCLSHSSGAAQVRLDFCEAVMMRTSYTPGPRIANALRMFRQYLVGGDPDKLLAPWLGGHYFSAIFAAGDKGPRHARSFFAALRSLIEQDTPLTDKDVDNLESFANELPDVTEVMACFLTLKAVGFENQYVGSDSLRCAYRLRSHGVDFGSCVAGLEKMGRESSEPVIRIVDALHAAGQVGVAAQLVRHGDFSQLISAGRRLEVLVGLIDVGQPAVAVLPESAAEWIHRYPHKLHEAMTRLAAVTTDAEVVAQRVLAKDLPQPESLSKETAALQELLRTQPGNSHLETRLKNLRARQSAAPVVSPARLDYLRTRLESSASRLWLENWLRQIEEQVLAKLRTFLGIASIPDWLWKKPNLRLVSAISQLEGRFREIGFQLIRRRCGPPPWDFHSEPGNQAFLALLRKRGVNPDPLVDPPADISIEDAQGRRYQLGIERDPLEVLRMGEPFETCLSPDGGNFFSAIVNAVDINKRVIYARDTEGKIVGRCLLAVTDLGRLLTFRVYCNIKDLDLQAAVSQFVDTLARSMGMYVAKKGTVPALLAPKWYDDGPQDLGSQYAFLAPGSAFRVALTTLPLVDVLPTIHAAFAPLPLDDVLLALVLELAEFDRRPELILPLIPLLESARHLPESLQWRAAARAHKAGRSDFAARVLNGRKLITRLVQAIEREGVCPCCSAPALLTLVELEPTTALRVLRLTRGKGIRSDEAEEDRQRRDLLAEAHSRLGRDVLAGRLRR